LVNGERSIITNFAVRVQPWVRRSRKRGKLICKPEMGLKNYLLQTYGKDFDVENRVKILDETEASTFFLHRRNCESFIKLDAEYSSPDKDGDSKVVKYKTEKAIENGGVFYVIDEAWSVFGSREWQKTGKGVLYYAAQHRKLSDTLLLCSQSTKQVETQLRQVAQDFWVCQNHSKKKIGAFRQPSMFSVAVYSSPPDNLTAEPMERRVFTLDKAGLGSCFDTAGGVGVMGGGSADIGEKIKGLPWWGIPVAVLGIGAAIILVAKGGGWFTGSLLTGAFNKKGSSKSPISATVTHTGSTVSASVAPVTKAVLPDVLKSEPVADPIYVTGFCPVPPHGMRVCLSDGRILREGEFEKRAGGLFIPATQEWALLARPMLRQRNDSKLVAPAASVVYPPVIHQSSVPARPMRVHVNYQE